MATSQRGEDQAIQQKGAEAGEDMDAIGTREGTLERPLCLRVARGVPLGACLLDE